MSQALTLINVGAVPWSAEYKLGSTTYSLSVPAGEKREVIADEFKHSGTWQEVGVASVANSQGGFAKDADAGIPGALVMLFGGICALSFWHTVKPHE